MVVKEMDLGQCAQTPEFPAETEVGFYKCVTIICPAAPILNSQGYRSISALLSLRPN
jgi:hypothetical protein